jgi:hypothetical protein
MSHNLFPSFLLNNLFHIWKIWDLNFVPSTRYFDNSTVFFSLCWLNLKYCLWTILSSLCKPNFTLSYVIHHSTLGEYSNCKNIVKFLRYSPLWFSINASRIGVSDFGSLRGNIFTCLSVLFSIAHLLSDWMWLHCTIHTKCFLTQQQINCYIMLK